ncbi:hypothetical protein DIPPA_08758 [Diplonema papillatum]|nr:hypothetical protein DIPPA_27470 [Diplonema papillatum]KAJ9460278.1 hypothetical protein DIPPA_08758 [Diplonema papillatum]
MGGARGQRRPAGRPSTAIGELPLLRPQSPLLLPLLLLRPLVLLLLLGQLPLCPMLLPLSLRLLVPLQRVQLLLLWLRLLGLLLLALGLLLMGLLPLLQLWLLVLELLLLRQMPLLVLGQAVAVAVAAAAWLLLPVAAASCCRGSCSPGRAGGASLRPSDRQILSHPSAGCGPSRAPERWRQPVSRGSSPAQGQAVTRVRGRAPGGRRTSHTPPPGVGLTRA